MSALPTPSTLSPKRPIEGTVVIRRGARRSGDARLASMIAAWIVVAGIAGIGLAHATGGAQDAGVSLAVTGIERGAATARSVVVRNGSGAPFAGELVMSTANKSSSTPLRLQPGESRTVAISPALGAACRSAVDIRLDAAGAAPETITLPCPAGAKP